MISEREIRIERDSKKEREWAKTQLNMIKREH